jgi:hypothetical protein
MKRHLLMSGGRSLNEPLSQALKLEDMEVAAGLQRSCMM